jgi:hypothetical protein
MHSAAFAAGTRSTLAGLPPPEVGTTADPPLGDGPDVGMVAVHALFRLAVAEESIALSGTVTSAFPSTHTAAFAAGARSPEVPVMPSRRTIGTIVAPPDGDPPASIEHVVASSTAVVVPATPFARRHDAAETIGPTETSVPVRDEVTFVSLEPSTVDGPAPHSDESDA